MILASEARELAGPTIRERVEALEPLIRAAAEKKQRQIILHDWWANVGYEGGAAWKEAEKILKEFGYTLEFFYEERQFVDMYAIVRW